MRPQLTRKLALGLFVSLPVHGDIKGVVMSVYLCVCVYIQALWDQMYQLTPALAVRAFTAVSSWTDQLPEGLLAKVLAQSTAHVTGQTSAAAAALPKGPGGRVVLPGALQTLSTQQMAQFVIQLQRSVQASQAAGEYVVCSVYISLTRQLRNITCYATTQCNPAAAQTVVSHHDLCARV